MTDVVLQEVLAHSTPFALPMATRFRGIEVREGVLIQGPSGWGEFAPFAEYDDVTAARWLASALEAAFGSWPAARRGSIPVNAIIPALSAQEAATLTYRACAGDGCSTVKVKVGEPGQSLEDDIARVAAVRSALAAATGARTVIRIDVNGAWTPDEAVAAIRELDIAAEGLEFVEQPCRTFDELAELRRRVSVPIAADELIRTAADPILAVQAAAADIVVVKVPPLGGVNLALRVCEAAGVPVVVSGAMDSSVGLASGIALAACLESLPYACGLGTGALLADDLVVAPLRPRGGHIAVARLDPDPDALARAAARLSSDRARWWLSRIEGAWNAGADALAGHLVRGSRA